MEWQILDRYLYTGSILQPKYRDAKHTSKYALLPEGFLLLFLGSDFILIDYRVLMSVFSLEKHLRLETLTLIWITRSSFCLQYSTGFLCFLARTWKDPIAHDKFTHRWFAFWKWTTLEINLHKIMLCQNRKQKQTRIASDLSLYQIHVPPQMHVSRTFDLLMNSMWFVFRTEFESNWRNPCFMEYYIASHYAKIDICIRHIPIQFFFSK